MRRLSILLSLSLALAGCNGDDGDVASSGLAKKGVSICGSSQLKGKRIPRVRSSSNPSCGFGDAVEVYSVAGVAVIGSPQMRCDTAKAFETWTRKSAIPAVRQATGERLTSMTVWVGYACRSRSSGRKLSEHAKGNAIDISAFTTNRGSFTVAKNWRKGAYGRAMLKMKSGACGPFGVVLHPDNDRHHWNHFHFDTSNRSGRYIYCRENP